MKAVILAGGMGTRLREETEFRPKPMVEIGGRPILWHIMKMLGSQNLTEFIVCLGYKGDLIKDYFLNYETRSSDITVSLGSNKTNFTHSNSGEEKWDVTLANTGANTLTGGRIHLIKKYVGGERFLCTYGDGLANLDLRALINFHESHGKIATVTAVQPISRFGSIEITSDRKITRFSEKPKSEQWINGGYFIFEPEIFDFLTLESILEKEPLESLAVAGQLMAYLHNGFWQPMDTYRESQELNAIWDSNIAPWKNW